MGSAETDEDPVAACPTPIWQRAPCRVTFEAPASGKSVYRLGDQPMPTLTPDEKVWVLLDRVEIGKTPSERLTESVDAAFRRGQGQVGILTDTSERVFDQRFVCGEIGRASCRERV